MHKAKILLLTFHLCGCSVQLLEQVDLDEATTPRPCSETTKLFGTFSMRAARVAWSSTSGETAGRLELDLVFVNDKRWPIALSNSGNGVLYEVEFRLRSRDGASHAPMEATGIVLIRKPREFKEPPRPGPFGYITRPKQRGPAPDNIPDVNLVIKPGVPAEGRLVFDLPRGNYLFTVERKFANNRRSSGNSSHIVACKIAADEFVKITADESAVLRQRGESRPGEFPR